MHWQALAPPRNGRHICSSRGNTPDRNDVTESLGLAASFRFHQSTLSPPRHNPSCFTQHLIVQQSLLVEHQSGKYFPLTVNRSELFCRRSAPSVNAKRRCHPRIGATTGSATRGKLSIQFRGDSFFNKITEGRNESHRTRVSVEKSQLPEGCPKCPIKS